LFRLPIASMRELTRGTALPITQQCRHRRVALLPRRADAGGSRLLVQSRRISEPSARARSHG
jgi:hypothetical protein